MDDIWMNIFKLVDIYSLNKCFIVSKYFGNILKKETLWQHHYVTTFKDLNLETTLKYNYFDTCKGYYNLSKMIYNKHNNTYFKQIPVINILHFGISNKNIPINNIYNQTHLYLMKKLKCVCIDDCKLSKIPNEIFQIQTLEYLHASTNYIKTIPTDLFQLTNLVHLDLTYNYIETVPTNICLLTKLKYLYLKNNKITTLPTTIYTMKNLNMTNIYEFS